MISRSLETRAVPLGTTKLSWLRHNVQSRVERHSPLASKKWIEHKRKALQVSQPFKRQIQSNNLKRSLLGSSTLLAWSSLACLSAALAASSLLACSSEAHLSAASSLLARSSAAAATASSRLARSSAACLSAVLAASAAAWFLLACSSAAAFCASSRCWASLWSLIASFLASWNKQGKLMSYFTNTFRPSQRSNKTFAPIYHTLIIIRTFSWAVQVLRQR